jgi:hypothetical protein
LQGGDEAALFICPLCGRAHEPGEGGLTSFLPLTAAMTTELAVSGSVQYLAVWRMEAMVSGAGALAWERIRRMAIPELPHLYVPAFTLVRPIVQRLGVSLTVRQPSLELSPGLTAGSGKRPELVGLAGEERENGGPEFGTFSPVVVGRKDARILAHFVYLAVESHEVSDLQSIDYELQSTNEQLVLIPAVWDPRYIHESNWRLLLREFDGLVA